MKRIVTIFLTLVMVFSCSYTALANITVTTGIKVINAKGTKDVTLMMKGRYVTDDGVLMLPILEVLKQTGFTNIRQVEEDSVISAIRLSDNRNFAFYYKGSKAGQYLYQSDYVPEQQTGNLLVKPTIVNGVTMVAAKDLYKITGDTARTDVSKGAYYIVVKGCENVDTTVAKLPTAAAAEVAMVHKYAPSKAKKTLTTTQTTTNNSFKVNVVTTHGTTDITVDAKMVDGKLMVAAKPVLQAFGASVVWTPSLKSITSYTADSRLIHIPFNGSKTVEFIYDPQKTTASLTVAPKLINGTAMMYYGDFSYLFGSVSSYDPTTKTYSIVAVDALDIFTFGESNVISQTKGSNSASDDRVSPEQFAKNKTLQAAYYRLACDIIREELKYPNTAVFSSNYKVTKMQSDGTTSSFVKSLERQFGTKLDKDFIELLDEINEETGANEPSETVKVDGYVKAQNGFGLMKEVPFWMTFDVLNRTVNYIMFDGEPVWHYTTDKKGNLKLHEPSYSLKGYYY